MKFDFEEDLERLEENNEQVQGEVREKSDELDKIGEAMEALEKDHSVKEQILKLSEQKKENLKELQTKLENNQRKAEALQEEIQNSEKTLEEETASLGELKELGEDVSDAEAILEDRKCRLEVYKERVSELLKKTMATVAIGFALMTPGVETAEHKKDFDENIMMKNSTSITAQFPDAKMLDRATDRQEQAAEIISNVNEITEQLLEIRKNREDMQEAQELHSGVIQIEAEEDRRKKKYGRKKQT